MTTIQSLTDVTRSFRLSLRNFSSSMVAESLINLPSCIVLSAYGMSGGYSNGANSDIIDVQQYQDDMPVINKIFEYLLSTSYNTKYHVMSYISKLKNPVNISKFVLSVLSLELEMIT